MDAIYSATALRDHQREVKQAAQERLVRITENGRGAYVFCSEQVFEQEINKAVENALYQNRVANAVALGREAIASGAFVEGIDAARAEIATRRAGLHD